MDLDLSHVRSIVILTGAGMSGEPDPASFVGNGRLWSKLKLEDIETMQGFLRYPELVHKFYNRRRRRALSGRPTAAHHALARLELEWQGQLLLVTQNLDSLHELARSKNARHMYGELNSAHCISCGVRVPWLEDLDLSSACPCCSDTAFMRPDVVWFRDKPYFRDETEQTISKADLFLCVGTPDADHLTGSFLQVAKARGAVTVELTHEPSSARSEQFDGHIIGPLDTTVPVFVDRLLAVTPPA